ncbi:MAG TPA: sortase [Actinomycetota bacterium]|nr:sortase [Actinomycetota bacterium]
MSTATEVPPPSRLARARDRRVNRVLRFTGWTLIAAGFLVIAFILYELLATGLITARYQQELRDEFAGGRGRPGSTETLRPVPGHAVGIIRIPEIGLDMAVVEGITPEDLKKGPGHYPGTPLPGTRGNVGIAGHRTTYARPFWALDRLDVGDRILVDTRRGRFIYRVEWARVVAPNQVEVLDPTPQPSLTLTTCHPKFSAAQRLVVRAVQMSGAS